MIQPKKKQIFMSVVVILGALPGSLATAAHFHSTDLIWLIPQVPAFTVVFYWIVNTLVRFFIEADSYKDQKAIAQARAFLGFFDVLFLGIWTLFLIGEALLFYHFRA